jgi:hypothetical protein
MASECPCQSAGLGTALLLIDACVAAKATTTIQATAVPSDVCCLVWHQLLHMQGFWWRTLATCCQAVAATTAGTWPPFAAWYTNTYCTAHFAAQAYPGRLLAHLDPGRVATWGWETLHLLLLGQLWDLWPWQLAQLQQADDSGQPSPSLAAAMGTVSSMSGCGAGAIGASSSSSSSSSSRSGCMAQSEEPRVSPHVAQPGVVPAHQELYRSVVMDWPLLPGPGGASPLCGPGPPPVTLPQLQLAVSALASVYVSEAPTAALLLALLLQRAGPGLRAEFLGGPGGTALLVACQYWGYHQAGGCYHAQQPRQYEMTFNLVAVSRSKPRTCHNSLRAALQGGMFLESSCKWRGLGTGPSMGLLLAWCYLQLVPGWAGQLPTGGPAGDVWGCRVASTPLHRFEAGHDATGELLGSGHMAPQHRHHGPPADGGLALLYQRQLCKHTGVQNVCACLPARAPADAHPNCHISTITHTQNASHFWIQVMNTWLLSASFLQPGFMCKYTQQLFPLYPCNTKPVGLLWQGSDKPCCHVLPVQSAWHCRRSPAQHCALPLAARPVPCWWAPWRRLCGWGSQPRTYWGLWLPLYMPRHCG